MQSLSKLSFARIIGISALVLVTTDARPLSLADEPLFLGAPVKPNLMLVIDDSGSMDSEVLMPANDGALWWHTGDRSFVGRHDPAAEPFGTRNGSEVVRLRGAATLGRRADVEADRAAAVEFGHNGANDRGQGGPREGER